MREIVNKWQFKLEDKAILIAQNEIITVVYERYGKNYTIVGRVINVEDCSHLIIDSSSNYKARTEKIFYLDIKDIIPVVEG